MDHGQAPLRRAAPAGDRTDARALLAGRRIALLARALDAAQSRDHALAARLHDEVLQPLLATGQDLVELDAIPQAMALRSAVRSLQDALAELDQRPLCGSEPAEALSALAARVTRSGGPEVRTDLAPVGTAAHTALLVGIARELVVGALRAPSSGPLALTLRADGPEVVLAVSLPAAALDGIALVGDADHGRSGLEANAERVGALGGELRVGPGGPGRLEVTVRLPA